jgi:hypothetical protein
MSIPVSTTDRVYRKPLHSDGYSLMSPPRPMPADGKGKSKVMPASLIPRRMAKDKVHKMKFHPCRLLLLPKKVRQKI